MNNQQFCSKCGAKLEPGCQFCPHCGAKISAHKSESTDVKKCDQCQADIPIDAVKCPHCGSWVKEVRDLLFVDRLAGVISIAFLGLWFIWLFQNKPFYNLAEIFTTGPAPIFWLIIIVALIVSLIYDYKLYKKTGRFFWI